MAEALPKILLVDDEQDITYVVQFLLSHSGFDVLVINDSTKALAELRSGSYRLMIVDLMMPKLDGFSLIKTIREEEALSTLPILVLSSRQISPAETALLEGLRADVMAKPFETHRLVEKVREILAD